MGYVYIMEVPDLKRCKVGVSEHDPLKRKINIQTGCPGKIERIWQSRNIPDFVEIEKMMHIRFMGDNTNGEWFSVPYEKLVIEADKLCRCGTDKERIRCLEEENRILRENIEDLEKKLMGKKKKR